MQVADAARALFYIGLGLMRRILIFSMARARQPAEAAGQLLAVFAKKPRQGAFELCMNIAVAGQKTTVQEVDAEIDARFAQLQAFIKRAQPLIGQQSALPPQPD